MDRHPYLRYTGLSESESLVRSPLTGASFQLTPAERALAQLFDGSAAAVQRAEAAARIRPGITAAEFSALAAELAQAGLLDAGQHEPLPVPAHTGTPASSAPRGFPPSNMAGSLAAPGYPGGITGALERFADADSRLWRRVQPGPWLGLGQILNRTLDPPALRYGLWIAAAAGLLALWFHRLEAARDAARLMVPLTLLLTAALSAVLVNVLSQLARAAAIRRWTGQPPVMGLYLSFRVIPRLVTDTEGPAERAERAGRVRIVGAALNATLLIFVLALLGWFLTQRSGSILPSLFLGLAAVALAGFLFRANPLAYRDGYHLLANQLGVADLREQAWMALLAHERPWPGAAPLPRRKLQLYAGAVLLYMSAVVSLLIAYPGHWLETTWGGTGVLAFLSLMGVSIWEQTRRFRSPRKDIGGFSMTLKKPSRRSAVIAAAIAALCLFPYTYEPSGEFVVLPKDRADVRALVRGDVRAVLVQEGDQVQAGQEIARLSDYQEKAQVAASEARLQQLKADLALAEAGARAEEIEIAKQRVATARTRSDVAGAEAKRLQSAYERRAVSVQDYQRAQGIADVQRQELAEAERALELVTGGTRPERIEALKALVAAEDAQLAYHREQLKNTSVRAPIAGRIVSGSLLFARGKYLEAGQLLAVVEDTSELSAELRVPESQAPDIVVDAAASVRVWAMPGTSFDGKVVEVAPNAEDGPYGKVVRVRVLLEPASGLRPQMTGQGKVEGRTYPAIVVFTKALTRFLLIEVWSWLP